MASESQKTLLEERNRRIRREELRSDGGEGNEEEEEVQQELRSTMWLVFLSYTCKGHNQKREIPGVMIYGANQAWARLLDQFELSPSAFPQKLIVTTAISTQTR